jgi:HEAT repeat protein
MAIMCLLGKHKWTGCKCSVCGKKRDEGHDWSKDCEKCVRCGAERKDAHKLNGCKCSVCGKSGAEYHNKLMGALKDKDIDVRILAAKALEGCGWQPQSDEDRALYQRVLEQRDALVRSGSSSVSELLEALKDGKPPELAEKAAVALGKIRDKMVVPGLVAALLYFKEHDKAADRFWVSTRQRDDSEHGGYPGARAREQVAVALGKIGDAQAVPGLLHALEDDIYIDKSYVVKALGEIGDERAVPSLVKALKSGRDNVQILAAEGLRKIGWQPQTDEEKILYYCGLPQGNNLPINELEKIGRPAIPLLRKALESSNASERVHAANALVKINAPTILDKLALALWAGSVDVRKSAADALVEIGDSAVPILKDKLIDDRDLERRAIVANLLGRIGIAAVPTLLEQLRFSDGSSREPIEEALVEIGPRAVPGLVEALKDLHTVCYYWISAAETLRRIGWHPQTDEEKILYYRGLQQGDELVKIGAPAVPMLLEFFQITRSQWKDCLFVVEALGRIGDARAVPALLKLVMESDRDVRKSAAEALGKIGWQPQTSEEKIFFYFALQQEDKLMKFGGQLAPNLLSVASDEDEFAFDVLLKVGAPSVDGLVAFLKDASLLLVKKKKELVAKTLVKIGTPSIDGLIDVLKDGYACIEGKELAAKALVKIGAPSVLGLLEVLKNNYPGREYAARALLEIGTPAKDCLLALEENGEYKIREAIIDARVKNKFHPWESL